MCQLRFLRQTKRSLLFRYDLRLFAIFSLPRSNRQSLKPEHLRAELNRCTTRIDQHQLLGVIRVHSGWDSLISKEIPMRLASFAAIALALFGFVFAGTGSVSALPATGLAGDLGTSIREAVEVGGLLQKTHGSHRSCIWTRRRSWHRQTGPRNLSRSCFPHNYYDYGYYYGPYFYWGPSRRTYRGFRRRGPRVTRPRGGGGRRR